MSQKSERKIILEVLGGKLSSYEVIVNKYQNMIYSHTYKILHNSADAEDATQETFVRAYENLRKFDIEKAIKPWLYKIATNYCYDIIRKNSRVTQLDMDIQDDKESVISKLIQKEEKSDVRKAVNSLPDEYKSPILDYYFKNESYRLIASKLSLPINTVKTRLRRAKKMLKNRLK